MKEKLMLMGRRMVVRMSLIILLNVQQKEEATHDK